MGARRDQYQCTVCISHHVHFSPPALPVGHAVLAR